MKLLLTAFLAASIVVPAHAQDAPQATLSARLGEVLQRESSGHSPTDEDIAATLGLKPSPNADEVRAALPLLLKTLESPDGPARSYALSLLVGMENQANQADPAAPAATDSTQPTSIVAFKSDVAQVLTTAIPKIAAHLTDEVPANRNLAATILGGFTPNPPASVYPPLYAFLKREDAIGALGQPIVVDLLQLGPLSDETVAAIARFMRRSDQNADTRSNLVDAIATSPNQSQALNKALLSFLDSDDPSLRARVILSLPPLDLAPDVYTDTHTRVAQLVDNSSENLQVVNAARAVASCWTAPKMTSGCPSYQ